MSKTIKSSELIKRLEDNELKEGQKFKFISTTCSDSKIIVEVTQKKDGLFLINMETGEILNTGWLINSKIEVIEEQEEIDIQKITDIKDVFIDNAACGEDVKYLARKYNEILKWAKQLDKKTKEKK